MAEAVQGHGHDEQNSIFKIGINLTIACLLSGAIIAGTYSITAPIAAQERVNLKNRAMKELVAEAQTFQPIQGKADWYAAQKDGKIIAYVVPAESKGYGGGTVLIGAVWRGNSYAGCCYTGRQDAGL